MDANKIMIRGLDKPVTRVALGTWAIGGWMWGGPDDEAGIRTIRRALEEGINLIDTAPVYGFGHSEEVVGRALADMAEKPYIATKLGLKWDNGKVWRDSSPARIRQEVEDSLRRLRVDVIDLEQVHWPDANTPIEETARELQKLHEEGKIRALGVSNYSPEQMDIFRQAAPLSTVQSPFNIFEQATKREIIPYAEKHDMDVLCYGPICRGLLTGKMNKDSRFPDTDLRSGDPKFQAPAFANYLAAVDAIKALADKRGVSVMAFAIRWVLDQGPDIALWGARKPEQIDGVSQVFNWTMTPQENQAVEEIVRKYVPNDIEPTFMAPPNRSQG
ncbi:aldo/keto reductase [Oecophyllibacter saccharovorans]|uniref:aldo/keto reductase n=1 Tax=Oecophyllibacter saccharovorans TaxID=2558360 RepID=UPI001168945C|nr:aldo/keto reductase [Oecophyllibacter saccharovorans]TPW36491.1 aldo/keto reductase [Oecophyllibacter saccharovorans]